MNGFACHCKLARQSNPTALAGGEAPGGLAKRGGLGDEGAGHHWNIGILKYWIDGFSQKPKHNEQFILFKGLHLLIKFDTDKTLKKLRTFVYDT